MPPGAVYTNMQEMSDTVVNAFASCDVAEDFLAKAWASLEPGVSILALPVCSDGGYDRAFELLYMVH
eukprot:10860571-Heterocapsa_arctica.AAC.1